MNLPAWSTLLPPLITLLAAGITKNVGFSLLLGIGFGSYLATEFSITASLSFSIHRIASQLFAPSTLILFIFLSLLAFIIELMRVSGGVAAYVGFLQKRIKNKKHAELAVFVFSGIFCIDDYINNMLTGAIIRPFAERFSIAREKIAFLLNSLSSPVVAIIPASTWAAMIITRLETGGISLTQSATQLISADPFFVYLHAIPCTFYSFLIISSALYIVLSRRAYGPMLDLEKKAELQQPMQEQQTQKIKNEESIAGFLIPLACFLLFLPIFLLYLGNSNLFGGTNSVLDALKTTNIMASFCYTGAIAAIILGTFLIHQKKETIKSLVNISIQSIWSMRNSFKILTLAFTLGAIISQDLHAGSYIASLICCNLSTFLLPAIIFLLASATTASTGSSWGTIAIITPLALQTIATLTDTSLPATLSNTPLLYQTIGAILSGAVAGAHISPLTEATIISSTAAQADHLQHVKTQLVYATPAFLITGLLFLITGLYPDITTNLGSCTIMLILGITITISVIGLISHKKENCYN